MVIGLDCAAPELIFDRWLDDLPNLKSICRSGLHGLLRSCDPPITVPAWSVMMSSKSPGRLGVYGFRNRADHSYDRYSIANSLAIKEDRLWDILSRCGKRSIVIGVPGTYPPRPLNGLMVSDFLTPDITCEYTHPPELKQEIERVVGEYILDVRDFRSGNKEKILADIYEMTRKRFQLARHLLAKEDWDFFMMVEMGVDRIHHAFWDNMDPAHRFYEPGNKFENAIHDYYREVDREIGELLAFADDEDVLCWWCLITAPSGWMAASALTNGCLQMATSLSPKNLPAQRRSPNSKLIGPGRKHGATADITRVSF